MGVQGIVASLSTRGRDEEGPGRGMGDVQHGGMAPGGHGATVEGEGKFPRKPPGSCFLNLQKGPELTLAI